jgi:hypothetical protein
MFDVPVTVRYDFNIKKQSFFTSAGLISSSMRKEKYTYLANVNMWTYENEKEYKNSGKYYLSNLQLSAGYNHKLSSKLKIRLEPYITVPLAGIGVGRLPMTSMGVLFGVMRDLR